MVPTTADRMMMIMIMIMFYVLFVHGSAYKKQLHKYSRYSKTYMSEKKSRAKLE